MSYGGSGRLGRNVGTWSAGFALFVALLALFTSLQLFQLTAEGSAKRTLRRSLATLTEIDPLLARNFDDLQRSAENADAGETVQLDDFPIDVPLTPVEVTGASQTQLRGILLNRAADVMYSRGTDALRAESENQNVGRFSTAGITQHGLGFLRSRNHDILAVTTFILAALSIALTITLASTCRVFGRLTSIGVVVVLASVPVFAGGLGARFFLRIAGDGDAEYVRSEFLEIGRGLAWISIRDGAALAMLGLSLLVIGLVCSSWSDRSGAPSVPAIRS
jgi:hypothetical protein